MTDQRLAQSDQQALIDAQRVIAEQADRLAAQEALISNQSADLATKRDLAQHVIDELAAVRAARNTDKHAITLVVTKAA